MSQTQREKIINKAREILEKYPNGIRYTELTRLIKVDLFDIPENTIQSNIWNLDERVNEISKPERGIFFLTKYLSPEKQTESLQNKTLNQTFPKDLKITERVKVSPEESFYQPFADYLLSDLEECTKAIALGGNKFGDRWGTPDVFGIYKFSDTDPIRPQIEIVSVEIKTDTNQLITAFGQASAYKLFSHKVYLVIPKDVEGEISRIESLCLRYGIGLILFDRNNHENPNFLIRTRAIKNEPDYFYLNLYLKRLGDRINELF
ncbi:hypothetical protein A3C67_03105 [Candidatus Nomurabacteria bacterium RIFCSPHIGHO2_02_FULL_42_19]|uniref:HTH HARE-type domain-containing protein n=1 Tax=Candidatus Nomurabacteria bacterium RIFCSPHIGHO2_02_FULL_42_19 TaxID=1801756 RepID=A0A1F6W3G9_9BACT|nr:MAG: hypothetical protein A3C67_03105 [Candidatus Nomurabacteria bacterium RIFCSPHIGHO2_02_FULL_42_19]